MAEKTPSGLVLMAVVTVQTSGLRRFPTDSTCLVSLSLKVGLIGLKLGSFAFSSGHISLFYSLSPHVSLS